MIIDHVLSMVFQPGLLIKSASKDTLYLLFGVYFTCLLEEELLRDHLDPRKK